MCVCVLAFDVCECEHTFTMVDVEVKGQSVRANSLAAFESGV